MTTHVLLTDGCSCRGPSHLPSCAALVDEWPLSCALRSSAFFSVFVDLYVLDTFTVV